jgi:CBS domain containing-hemolysin-like protein
MVGLRYNYYWRYCRVFWEIEDEHDSDEELIEKEMGDDTYIFFGWFDVEYLNQTYKLYRSDSYGI